MAKTAQDIIRLIQEQDIKMVDFKIVDINGQFRHVTIPAANFNEEEFMACHGLECVECGCCSFICPAKRPLTQNIKSMRKILLAKKKR